MKKSSIFLTLFVTIFSLHSVVQAEPFTLISSHFAISGNLMVKADGVTVFDGSSSVSSPIPVAYALDHATFSVRGEASYREVWARPSMTGGAMAWGDVTATTTLTFAPNFSGQASAIGFSAYWYGEPLMTHVEISLTDITGSTTLLSLTREDYRLVDFSNPYWYAMKTIYPDGIEGDNTFRYPEWNPEHEYQLVMSVRGSMDPWESGLGGIDVSTNIAFNNVPEPFTLLLLASGLVGLLGLRRKLRRH